jgi:hypothetical protein
MSKVVQLVAFGTYAEALNTATALSIVAARCEDAGWRLIWEKLAWWCRPRPGLTGTVEFAAASLSRGG